MQRILPLVVFALIGFGFVSPSAESACCYFSAKDTDILQPAQKCFLTYDPAEKIEAFTVQPKFEGNALDFGMVIPTPTRPKLDPMPRDFFKHLAVFTILKKREHPKSKLLPEPPIAFGGAALRAGGMPVPRAAKSVAKSEVRVLESGVVGSLDYKIIEAGRADDLFNWLKDNRYNYSGDEATLDFYVKKSWLFTVMKIDTAQMKKNADGTFLGEVTPTRFRFSSDEFVYPLKITQLSVKDKTEALIYVQAPMKCDLPGDDSYQFQWVPMLQNARGWYAKGIFGPNELPGRADDWLKSCNRRFHRCFAKARIWGSISSAAGGQRPIARAVRRQRLSGARSCRSTISSCSRASLSTARIYPIPTMVLPERMWTILPSERRRMRPFATGWRDGDRNGRVATSSVNSPAADVQMLKQLLGHLTEGQYVTKMCKVFTKGEMNDDLKIVTAQLGGAADMSEYTEILPTSPP